MKLKLLTTAAVAACIGIGSAVAQEARSGSGGQEGQVEAQYASEQERTFYEEQGEMLRPFFADESMTQLRSEEEVQSAFDAMDAESRTAMETACERAQRNRGSYGSVTLSLCEQVGLL